jgi:NDP-sugar pyrophosphorylase family protein
MKAVILAGGLGTRLRPFTEMIPKPLLPIGEKAILEIQIDRLKKYGFNEVFLCTNYKSEYIRNFFGDGSRYGVKITVSEEDIPLGTAGPLTLLKDELAEPFIVMNGDILTLLDFGKFYRFACDMDSLLTIAIKQEIEPFDFGNIFFEGDFVTEIQEKPDIVVHIMAGVYFMRPAIFEFIPDNKYFGVDTLIRTLLGKGMNVAKYEMKEYWLDVGRVTDYEKAQEAYDSYFKVEQ